MSYNDRVFNKRLVETNVAKMKRFKKLKEGLESFDDEVLFTRKMLEEKVGLQKDDIPDGTRFSPAHKEKFEVEVWGEKVIGVRYFYTKEQLLELVDTTLEKCQENLSSMVSRYDSEIEEIDNQIKVLEERKSAMAEVKKFIDEVGA